MEDAEFEVTSSGINGSLIYNVVSDVLAFLLYMHQQIPSILQDMTLEFDVLQTEHKELVRIIAQGEVSASSRRKHFVRKREVKLAIRRVDKLMNTISDLQTAFQLIITEVPIIEEVILILGASPRRPQHVYEMYFSWGRMVPETSKELTKSRTTELLSRKVIRALISKGVGSSSYTGPYKLFLLVKAPVSFSMPLHFLPKRDLRYNKKIAPLRLRFKYGGCCQESYTSHCDSQIAISKLAATSEDLTWFQCRHVIKGLALKNQSPAE
ncbi:hypothetical protein Nepgr_029592 [Nepenthes gracilis]|uniref:Uncharacterized protein n=1 Tax=Nepenthes gracilis TaxID=150966 RepID=A0AAD3Y582_NEPGR|nr:hypothetical protein Nepgr_029592 [Nepenthes gracilis]